MVDRHPLAPSDFDTCSLPIVDVSQTWWRAHPLTHGRGGAVFFGRTRDNRFDAPGMEYGTLYLAENVDGAFVEVVLRDSGLGTTIRIVSETLLRSKLTSNVSFSTPLKLVDLTGSGLVQIGADARLWSGENYLIAQNWAHAMWNHPMQPDGILYPSRHDPSCKCAVIYDRAPNPTATFVCSFWDLPRLWQLLGKYNVGLV